MWGVIAVANIAGLTLVHRTGRQSNERAIRRC